MRSQLKWGSILSYVQMATNILINILFTPIMIRMLGSSEYGLYNTVVTTISMLSILNLGFNSSYIRYYSKYKVANDEKSIAKLNGLFLTIFSIIGLIGLVCGLFLTFNLDLIFDKGLTNREYQIARTLMFMLTVNLAVSFPTSVFQSIVSAHEKYIFLKLTYMIRTLCGPLVSIPILLMGLGSISMLAVIIAFYWVADFLPIYYCFKKLKIKVSFGKVETGLFRNLFSYTIFIAINMIVDQINWNIGKVILGRYVGTAAVSVFAVGHTFSTSYNMLSSSISGVFTPRIHKIINISKSAFELRGKLTELFTKVGRIQFLILSLASSGIIFFGKQFITEFWAGKEYGDAYYVALLLTLPTTIYLIQNIGVEVQRAQNLHKFRSIVYLFMAFVNLTISIIMCQRYGAVGAAIGTAAFMLVANGLIINIYYHKKCNIDIIAFWKSVLQMLPAMILPIVSGVVITKLINTYSLIGFLIGVLLYSTIYIVCMWIFAMNSYEKDLIKKPITKFVSKFNSRRM